MKRPGRALLLAVLALGAGMFVWREATPPAPEPGASSAGGRPSRRGGGGRRGGNEGPVSVLTAPSRVEDVPVTLEAVGTAQALNTVTVRPQVDGRLVELTFREGQDVRRGDVIARIDPTVYQANYDQAVAKKAQDEANLANARLDLQRYVSLAATNAGSRQQADTQRAAVAQLEAQVKADQGAIDNTRAYLDYTTIRAPIDGRLGLRLIDQGNLVRSGETTGLVVITQLRPMTVLFSLPQQNLRAVAAAAAAGEVAVEALEADNHSLLDRGRLEVVDNAVDQQTGTVRAKATFPNAELQLWPGAFVNVRLTVGVIRSAVVVPTGAVQRGPSGAFVYGLEGDRAKLKPVAVGRQTETISVITSGLVPPEAVITTGFARLTDGDQVAVAESTPAPSVAGSGRPGEGGTATPRPRRARDGDIPTSSTSGDARPEPGPEGRPRRSREGRERPAPGSGPAPAGPAPAGATRP